MTDDVKHTVYLPADFVRRLQERSLAENRSSYGAVQAFLRRAVSVAMDDWKRREAANGASASASAQLAPATALVEVPAAESAFYEQLVRYLASEGPPDVQEWKRGLRRAVVAWSERLRALRR